MKRRLLLVEGDTAEQAWLSQCLLHRFRSIDVVTADSLNAAKRVIVEVGCDIIIAGGTVPDSPSPLDTVDSLQKYATGVPIIVVIGAEQARDSADVLIVGLKHILFREDLRQDSGRLTAAIVDTIHDLIHNARSQDQLQERFRMLADRLWRLELVTEKKDEANDKVLAAMQTSLDEIHAQLVGDSGLHTRVTSMEKVHKYVGRGLVSVAGAVGTSVLGWVGWLVTRLLKGEG